MHCLLLFICVQPWNASATILITLNVLDATVIVDGIVTNVKVLDCPGTTTAVLLLLVVYFIPFTVAGLDIYIY
jgi:hypothetical protein